MIIGVDIDCVLNDLAALWSELLNEDYGFHIAYDELIHYDMRKNYPTLDEIQVYEPLETEGFFDNLLPEPYSQAVLKFLNVYHDIYFVTRTQPWHLDAKRKWLETHYPFIPKNRLISTPDKSLIKLDMLIDDDIRNLVRGDGCITVKYIQPWNKDWHHADYEVKNFDEVMEIFDF